MKLGGITLTTLLLAGLSSARAVATAPETPESSGAPPSAAPRPVEMTTYQFVMLKTGPNRTVLPAAEAEAKQKAHLAGLAKLMASRTALAVGPVQDGGDLRGVVVLDVRTTQEAAALFKNDPWVSSGHLVAEIHPWFAAKDVFQPAPEFLDTAPCLLGLLLRPVDAPQFGEAELNKLQEGHMDNIRAMAASGDLVIAGPMQEDRRLRGIFVFRTTSAERVRELVARDPAVQARRLEVQLYTWQVSKGVLPPR